MSRKMKASPEKMPPVRNRWPAPIKISMLLLHLCRRLLHLHMQQQQMLLNSIPRKGKKQLVHTKPLFGIQINESMAFIQLFIRATHG